MKTSIYTLLVLLALGWAPAARADISPAPPADEDCTAEEQEALRDGYSCEECTASEEECYEEYRTTYYGYVCTNTDSIPDTLVYCIAGDAPLCAVTPSQRRSALLTAALFVLGVAVVIRRGR